jgi:ergothioneine biosynthesis protein EgtB
MMIDRYLDIRKLSEEICTPLKPEDYNAQVVVHASPVAWQLGHITWFFEEFVLSKHVDGYLRFRDDCAYIFNSYYNNVGDRTNRDERDRIDFSTEDVYAYRKYVDDQMVQLLQSEISADVRHLVEIGLNHEQQHQELLLTDLKFMLSKLKPTESYAANGARIHSTNSEEGWVSIFEGIYEIGHEGDGFCYDNELGRHKVYLHDFQISKSLVTNGEFIEFIEAGGYSDFNLWLDEGWAWVQKNNIESPLYWKQVEGVWHQFTLAGLKAVNPDEILCHVSFYEAAAFAEWKEMRLPTEFEWEIASEKFNWGTRWEWTNSAYLPYPGFKKAEGAIGEYNGKFMINQMVLRGASVATSPNHSRKTYRNFFHPHFQWQFSGIRLAR